MVMRNPTMTLEELRTELQRRGIHKGYASLKRMIQTGALPFVTVLNTGATNRCTYHIPRVGFERWADEYAPLADEAG